MNPNVIPQSQYKGVSWDKNAKKWVARVKYKSKSHFAGRYSNERAAAEAVNNKCMEIGIMPRNLELMPGWGKEVTSMYN